LICSVSGMPRETWSLWALFKDSCSNWNDIDAPRLGAALAYYTILSLAPLLVLVVSLGGLIFGRQAAEGQLVWQFQDTIGTQGAQAVQAVLQSAHKPAAGVFATIVGTIILLFSASSVCAELRDSLNDVWGVHVQAVEGLGGMLRYRFHAFAMVVGIGFLLFVSLVVSAFLAAAGKFVNGILPAPAVFLQVLDIALSLVVITVLFALIYKVVPDVPIAWRDVWVGAGVTSILFTIGKVLIGLYLGKASVGSAYGAAGSLVVLLVWVYYSAQIFLFGAGLTRRFAAARIASAAAASAAPLTRSIING
jgi:membrane protein